MITSESLIGSASLIKTSTLATLNPSAGNKISSSTALLSSRAILITNDYISKLLIRFTKLRDRINVITLLYGKTLQQTMTIKKGDKEAFELKKVYIQFWDKGKEI